jgi:hypothetical protein
MGTTWICDTHFLEHDMSIKSWSKANSAVMKNFLLYLVVLFGVVLTASAQHPPDFSSGSDGTDGALDLTGQKGVVNFVPSNYSGDQHDRNIFNFTTITIPSGVTLRISSTIVDGPVYFLASGDVDIEGTIDLSGQNGVPPSLTLDGRRRAVDAGVGGYDGGVGGLNDGMNNPNEPLPQPGDGPGGGAAGYGINNFSCIFGGAGGTFSGNTFLVPLVGGSGGGGGLYFGTPPTPYGASGGAGGGGLLIASSTVITVNGTINAAGGEGGTPGGYSFGPCYSSGYGGGGSGGGIRLAANTMTGTGTLTTSGGQGFGYQDNNHLNSGGNGVVRLEAFTLTFSGTITGTRTIGTPYTGFLMLPTTPPPTVTAISINNSQIPQPPTGSLMNPDVTIDTASPVTLTVQAAYIPLGTVVTLNIVSDNLTNQTVQTTPLAGTLQSSTATATVTFPSGYSLNYVKATWTMMNGVRKPK